jgi:hypothetical protein
VRAVGPADNTVSAALVWGFDHVIDDNAEPTLRERRETFRFDLLAMRLWPNRLQRLGA